MEDYEHEELLKALLKHPGKILISGYDNEMYNHYLTGWSKAYKSTTAENGLSRTETLWMNYSDKQMSIERDFPEVLP